MVHEQVELIEIPVAGGVGVFTGIVRDITERKRTEKDLREAEERMRSVVNHVVDGIITIDERGRLWVVENYSYPDWAPYGRDRVVIFEDTDGDGVGDNADGDNDNDGIDNLKDETPDGPSAAEELLTNDAPADLTAASGASARSGRSRPLPRLAASLPFRGSWMRSIMSARSKRSSRAARSISTASTRR